MNVALKKTVVAVSLIAFAGETLALAHGGKSGHALPSAMQMTVTASSTTAAMAPDFGLGHFPSAITEAIYADVAHGNVLRNAGQVTLGSSV